MTFGNDGQLVPAQNNSNYGISAFSTASDTATLTVTLNAAPQFTFTPTTTAVPTQEYYCQVTANSATATALTFTLTQAPTGMTIDPNTGLITWTPTAAQLATPQAVDVKATDQDGNSADKTWSIALNTAPVLTMAIPGSTNGPIVGSTLSSVPFTISISSFINHGAGTTTIVDADPGAIVGGIALSFTAVVGTGTWEYSLDGGATFQTMTVSDSHAILLPPRRTVALRAGRHRERPGIRSLPSLGHESPEKPAVSSICRKRTRSGNVIGTGGNNSISVAGDNVQITINDAPVLTPGHPSLGPILSSTPLVL